jgi:hypothetical protein
MVVRCSYCGEETELHQAGVPTCIICAARLAASKLEITRNVHSRLVQELTEAMRQVDAVNGIHEQVLANIPSGLPQPDGVQHIRWISREVSSAWQNVTRLFPTY